MSIQQSVLDLSDTRQGRTFEPVRYPSLAESVLAEVRQAIINGKVSPGERLVETDLAAQFQVSRATIRQAFTQLRFEGLVDVRPRRGTVVTRMSGDAARKVCIVRGLLEGWAARTACRQLTDAQFDSMRALGTHIGESVRKDNVYEVMELDIEFHSLICAGDPNEYLWERWQSLNSLHGALLASRLAFYNYDPVSMVRRHHELVDILATRNPDAAENAVRSHYIARFLKDGHAVQSPSAAI